jgi:hypothetical protein
MPGLALFLFISYKQFTDVVAVSCLYPIHRASFHCLPLQKLSAGALMQEELLLALALSDEWAEGLRGAMRAQLSIKRGINIRRAGNISPAQICHAIVGCPGRCAGSP